MDLLQDWRRRTLGAAVAAVLAPAAIVTATLTVGVGGGGLGSIRSIGQAVDGPELPAVAPAARADRRTADEAGRLLARVRPEHVREVRRRRPPEAAAPVATRTPAPVVQAVPAAPVAPVAPAAVPIATSTPAPARTPSPVRQIGDGVTSVTDQVPVAGEPVGQVVDLLADTVDGLPPGPIIH